MTCFRIGATLIALAVAFGKIASVPAADEPLFEAGFAETDITPSLKDKPVYLAGFGHNRKATGVHDPLMARTVVLRHGETKIAIASIDVVGFFYPQVQAIRARLKGFTYVLVSSTHNHEGPDTMGLWGSSPLVSGLDKDYMKFIEDRVVDAVRKADEACKPVSARIGQAAAPELLHDGREPYVKHDELTALAFREARQHKLAGLIVAWNCHPETLDSKNTLVSADYVGYTVSALRAKHRCPVVYLTGTVGGLMTSLHVEVRDKKGQPLKDGTYEKTARYGKLVADLANRALKNSAPLSTTPLEARSKVIYPTVENQYFLLARQLGVLQRGAFVLSGRSPAPADSPTDPNKPLSMQSEVAWLRLGALEIAAIPGEIYPELVLGKVQDPADPGADFPDASIEPAIYAQMNGRYKMLIGLANDEIGYILPKRQWDVKPPFCYGRNKSQYGEVNSLGPNTAATVCEAFRDIALHPSRKR